MPVQPALVFMHFLGGSAETWKAVEDRLEGRHACVRLDLPGFGDAAGHGGQSVAEMADWIERRVQARVSGRYVLVGHSMSAKVALLIARRQAQRGSSLAGLVLAAGSPPSPEPMPGDKRDQLAGFFGGDPARSRDEADGFIRDNVAGDLGADLHETAVGDVLRASPDAWRAWLESGSREDLAEAIGVLAIPALVLAGAQDGALGPEAQRGLMMPHLSRARLEVVEGAAHLLPMEQPEAVAALIADFVAGLGEGLVTSRTREIMEERGRPDGGYRPVVLDAARLSTLRAVVDCILPRPEGLTIDLAARLDAMLADGTGDGWRYAALPGDAESYRRGLATIEAAAVARYGSLAAADLDALLDDEALGSDGDGMLSNAQIALWLEELRGDAARLFMAHPATQERIGCVAVETGGDDRLVGFHDLAPKRMRA